MTPQTQPWLGTIVAGHDVPVINERAARAAAGILFLGGIIAYGLAIVASSTTAFLAAPLWITLALCGLCLTLLFLETAFGFCVGCTLHTIFVSAPPQYCPGDSCSTDETATHTSSPSTAVITAH